MMKILYMGTPDIAKEILRAIVEDGRDVAAVISQPDKPVGRHAELRPTAVKQYALTQEIEVFQPETLKDNAILPFLERVAPDLIVVAAYGKILPEYVLNFPKYGCINVHASLLPKYRGAAPIQRAIIEGEEKTGVSIMYMEKGLDTGDVILRREVAIDYNDTAESLHDKLAKLGGVAVNEAIDLIENNSVTREKQDDSKSTYAAMLTKAEGEIDWSQSAKDIRNKIRGLNPWPMAYSFINGARFIIPMAEISDKSAKAGEVISADENGLCVGCGEGALIIENVKFDGKKLMSVREYLCGHKIEAGAMLGGKE